MKQVFERTSMERMLPKMHKDLLGIVSVLCMVFFPHQVVAEESLCHLDFRPQPYSLEEEVGSLVWEYPKVPLQWKVDLNETNVWKEFRTRSRKEHRGAANRPCTFRRYLGTSARRRDRSTNEYETYRNPRIAQGGSESPCDSDSTPWRRKCYASYGKEQSRAEARKEDSSERREDCQETREKKPASKASRTG